MTALDLSTLRAIAEGATPGPWGRATTDGQGWAVHRGAHDTIALYCDRDNAAHIAAFNPETVLALLDRLEAAEAEAFNVDADYDRRGERLWRLAAKAGWTPGNDADNDATAELYIADALAERDALAAKVAAATPQVAHLDLVAQQLREQGDIRQVHLSDDGVAEAPTLADELWLIAYNLSAALAVTR